MRFVFFDTETSGTSIPFDQILQFGAVLTDEKFRIIDTFEARCRRLPWVVPSPVAMVVTGTSPEEMDDPSMVSFPEFVDLTRDKLISWSPATFVGYNSFRFDEPLLQRALWQALYPPYLTVTGGNSRFDLLPLAIALEALLPDALDWPKDDEGNVTFRLDRLGPHFGYEHRYAHDAVDDVKATIHIARLFASEFPEVWNLLIPRSSRALANQTLGYHKPILFAERVAGKPRIWWGQRIELPQNSRQAIFVNLAEDWRSLGSGGTSIDTDSYLNMQFRVLNLNKVPPTFTQSEAQSIFDRRLDANMRENSEFLKAWTGAATLAKRVLEPKSSEPGESKEIEEQIYDGFTNPRDEESMRNFHSTSLEFRWTIARSFQDRRSRTLAARLIYLSAPEYLPAKVASNVREGIRARLHPDKTHSGYRWRSVEDAKSEVLELRKRPDLDTKLVDKIEVWLKRLDELSVRELR